MIVATRGLGQTETALTPVTPASGGVEVTPLTPSAPIATSVFNCDPTTFDGTLNAWLGLCSATDIASELASQNLAPGASTATKNAVIEANTPVVQQWLNSLPSSSNPLGGGSGYNPPSCGLFQTFDTPSQTCVTSTLMIGLAVAAVAILALVVVKR